MNKLKSILFSFVTTSLLFGLFAVSMAYATFIENDYDTTTARALVYNSWWFNTLMTLIVLHLIGSLFYNNVFKLKKWSVLLFHLAFISMFVGSAITRYYSFEGLMNIREKSSSNTIFSSDSYLKVRILNKDNSQIHFENKHIISPWVYVDFKDTYKYQDKEIELIGKDFMANASEAAMISEKGKEVLTLFVSDTSGIAKRILIQKGEFYRLNDITMSFESGKQADIEFEAIGEKVIVKPNVETKYFNMFKNEVEMQDIVVSDTLDSYNLYIARSTNFVYKSYRPNAVIKTIVMDGSQGHERSNLSALILDLKVGSEQREIAVLTDPVSGFGQEKYLEIDGVEMFISFGKKEIKLPFDVYLNDFQLERYVGSNTPSSFKSLVTIKNEAENETFDSEIFMNNILDYKGYRFFQSSYDKDELGTVLSVNYDFWGTMITYLGYLLMTIGITFSMFNPKSRLMHLLKKTSKSNAKIVLLAFALLSNSAISFAQEDGDEKVVITQESIEKAVFDAKQLNLAPVFNPGQFVLPTEIDEKSAEQFGKLLVIDLKGRLKPINTLASEILRKIARKNSFEGFTPTQILMDMMMFPENWKNAPLINVSSDRLKEILNIEGDMASFNQIGERDDFGENIITQYAEAANNKPASKRDRFDKDVLKVNERANIIYMIFSRDIFKIFPDSECANCEWLNINELDAKKGADAVALATDFVNQYRDFNSGHRWQKTEQNIAAISEYQKKYTHLALPSDAKISAEIFYNGGNLFPKLAISYFFFGMILLIFSFVKLLNAKVNFSMVEKVLKGMILLTFAAHIGTFVLRWYIAGYAPMSNGYETILFIALITVLAGLIFSSRSQITYAVSAILASVLLLVASLSFFDPEITNQAPVLKSVWLVIHVAVITMSYGFFGIGALLGLFNLFLFVFMNKSNKEKLMVSVDELVDIIEITLTIGLYLLTVGTFLGAVWANESWGRYWGWDPKETWALITVLVYAIYIHMKRTKYFQNKYSNSLWAVICLSSVLMTYFGVNYFLSGLHSYAGDGPSNVPDWVYAVAIAIAALAATAYYRFKKIK